MQPTKVAGPKPGTMQRGARRPAGQGTNERKMNAVMFVNDHEPDMNVVAKTEEEIKQWIETNFDCKWKDVKDIEDVSCFYDQMDEEEIQSIGVEFTDLRS
jgi:hypothetical protein